MIDLKGKRILVTGSTTGVGLGIAETLLANGARVVTNSHQPPGEPAAQSQAHTNHAGFIQADLSRPEEAASLIEQAAELLGGLDGLVNNAGTFVPVSFMESKPEHFGRLFDLNVRGVYFASQAFARVVGKRDFDACIINIGSSNSFQAERDSVLYDASKGAVLMMTRSLAVTLAHHGIRANCVAPGLIKTPLTNFGHQSKPALQKLLCKQIPIGRIGEPRDVGGAVAFLLSDAAAYITGQALCADGGIIALQMTYDLD